MVPQTTAPTNYGLFDLCSLSTTVPHTIVTRKLRPLRPPLPPDYGPFDNLFLTDYSPSDHRLPLTMIPLTMVAHRLQSLRSLTPCQL
ncbi:hypothetical protein MA16_Dca006629 [Dendrobium catenatum]|uniref:Uncharacterized protein n=1 Tax=Dendrobium catenatum TaxID=906689 RepID=A0A2I0X5N5_9ASPA|nr:hypothetical protein MA16_Dca006629 [Dendrobium catenatum]